MGIWEIGETGRAREKRGKKEATTSETTGRRHNKWMNFQSPLFLKIDNFCSFLADHWTNNVVAFLTINVVSNHVAPSVWNLSRYSNRPRRCPAAAPVQRKYHYLCFILCYSRIFANLLTLACVLLKVLAQHVSCCGWVRKVLFVSKFTLAIGRHTDSSRIPRNRDSTVTWRHSGVATIFCWKISRHWSRQLWSWRSSDSRVVCHDIDEISQDSSFLPSSGEKLLTDLFKSHEDTSAKVW